MSEDNSKRMDDYKLPFDIPTKGCELPSVSNNDEQHISTDAVDSVESSEDTEQKPVESKCCDNCAKMTINNYKNTGCPFGKYNPIIGKFEQVFPPKVNWDKFNDSCTRFDLRKTDVEEKVSDAFSSEITYKRPY